MNSHLATMNKKIVLKIILKDKNSTVIMITHRNSEKIENLADNVITLGS